MGDWLVLSAWNSADGFHDWHLDGRYGRMERGGGARGTSLSARELLSFGCFPVVEQHQNFTDGPPEFTISVAWQDGHTDAHEPPSGLRGWRYKIHYTDTSGKEQWISKYGMDSREEARRLAEERATHIAKAQQPEDVYKFRPDI